MLEDTESDLNRAREDAGNIIRDLKRQNKLKQLIVDYFIPPDIVELLSRKAQWDEAPPLSPPSPRPERAQSNSDCHGGERGLRRAGGAAQNALSGAAHAIPPRRIPGTYGLT